MKCVSRPTATFLSLRVWTTKEKCRRQKTLVSLSAYESQILNVYPEMTGIDLSTVSSNSLANIKTYQRTLTT